MKLISNYQTFQARRSASGAVRSRSQRDDGKRGKGYGRQKGHTGIHRGAEYQVHFVPKIKLEIVVPSELADRVEEVIAEAGRTGEIGDGKIFVTTVDHALRIRTGGSDEDAL